MAFEKAEFKTVGEAAAALKKLGFIGGTGTPVKYSDFAKSVDNTGMTGLTPCRTTIRWDGGLSEQLPLPPDEAGRRVESAMRMNPLLHLQAFGQGSKFPKSERSHRYE